jgi:hypothetical protein
MSRQDADDERFSVAGKFAPCCRRADSVSPPASVNLEQVSMPQRKRELQDPTPFSPSLASWSSFVLEFDSSAFINPRPSQENAGLTRLELFPFTFGLVVLAKDASRREGGRRLWFVDVRRVAPRVPRVVTDKTDSRSVRRQRRRNTSEMPLVSRSLSLSLFSTLQSDSLTDPSVLSLSNSTFAYLLRTSRAFDSGSTGAREAQGSPQVDRRLESSPRRTREPTQDSRIFAPERRVKVKIPKTRSHATLGGKERWNRISPSVNR